MRPMRVPSDYSGEEAILILDFLEHLTDTIWCMHAEVISEVIQAQRNEPPEDDEQPTASTGAGGM